MKRILVALDSSPRAPEVLAAAARLARLCDARLVLFRAINVPPDVPRQLLDKSQQEIEDVLRASAHADLDRLASSVAPELVERITTELAVPWDGIVREGRKADADMIVIGSHGYGALDRLLGTTAAKVVNHADRNVLIVRTPL